MSTRSTRISKMAEDFPETNLLEALGEEADRGCEILISAKKAGEPMNLKCSQRTCFHRKTIFLVFFFTCSLTHVKILVLDCIPPIGHLSTIPFHPVQVPESSLMYLFF